MSNRTLALRDLIGLLEDQLHEAPVDKLAPLSKEYRAAMAELEVLEAKEAPHTENPLEKIKRERDARLAKSG